MPPAENQFLHAAVPVRGFLAACMGGVLLMHGRKGNMSMSTEGWWEFMALMVLDAGACAVTGLWLGRWDGIVSGATAALWGM